MILQTFDEIGCFLLVVLRSYEDFGQFSRSRMWFADLGAFRHTLTPLEFDYW